MVLLAFLFLQPIVELKTTVDREEITIGDPVKYQVEIEMKELATLETPDIKVMGNFEVLDKHEEREGDKVKLTYTITTFAAGNDTIPGFKLKGLDKEGNEWEATAQEMVIKVKSVLPAGMEDIKDIKSPVSIPRKLAPILLGVLIFCVVAGIVWWLVWRRRRRLRGAGEVCLRPAYEIAYERLKLLALENGNIKEYYVQLSDIIRRYVEARYTIGACTETTFELYRELRSERVEYDKVEIIKDFLAACDLVKFAKHIPPVESVDEDKERAKGIVDKTKNLEHRQDACGT
jgi:hypothetical protein